MLSQTIDAALQLIDREVWIITSATAGGQRGGLVATWVMQSSIDPERPTLVASIAANHYTAELIEASGSFAAHLVGREHLPLVWQFALGSGRDVDKLAGLTFQPGQYGAPILADCLAWFDCRVVEKYTTAGRHYYWAEVVGGGTNAAATTSNLQPLREKELFAAATPEQLAALRASREGDIAALRKNIRQ